MCALSTLAPKDACDRSMFTWRKLEDELFLGCDARRPRSAIFEIERPLPSRCDGPSRPLHTLLQIAGLGTYDLRRYFAATETAVRS
jgi:hypothetical protein